MQTLLLRFCFIASLILSVTLTGNAQNADKKSEELAKQVLKAMGGKKAWDNTRHISWNFFGARTLTWDKWTGNVRIETPDNQTIYLLNVQNMTGKAMVKGQIITQADSLQKALTQAKNIWINDSYWLVMPYKLLDPGVTLRYQGQQKTEKGTLADVIELTFSAVGVTPDNKYLVYFDPTSHLVTQWAYFAKNTDEKPRFVLPWEDYKTYGKIKLSGERGPRDLTNIQVFSSLPSEVYTEFTKPAHITN